MKNYPLLVCAAALVYANCALAQELPLKQPLETPREFIVRAHGLLPAAKPADITVEAKSKLLEPELNKELNAKAENTAIAKSIAPPIQISKPKPPAANLPDMSEKLQPFYMSAAEYLAARGSKPSAQMALKYTLHQQGLDGKAVKNPQIITILLGMDYAAIDQSGSYKIYDFKQNRLLRISPMLGTQGGDAGALRFDNTSLYARVYRNIQTVRAATQNGKLQSIPVGKDKSLDAYWINSAMNWEASQQGNSQEFTYKEGGLSVVRKQQEIFTADFFELDPESENIFQTMGFKDSFLRLAHYEWPLGPSVLLALKDHQRAPVKHMEIVSYGPRVLGGERQIWELTGHNVQQAEFPLPENALGAVQRVPITPMAFIINDAVRSKASHTAAAAKFLSAFKENQKKNPLMAWTAGQKYIAYSGICAGDLNEKFCQQIANFEEKQIARASKKDSPQNQKIADFIQGAAQAKLRVSRAASVKRLQPYLGDKDTPALILRIAAMAYASLNPKIIKMVGLDELNPEMLLQQSLAKDPYDPNTYVALAQFYAAKGEFEQSWNIYDALRAGIFRAQTTALKIDSVEKELRKAAPGYFLVQ